MNELLPCPFCGGQARTMIGDKWWVTCSACTCEIGFDGMDENGYYGHFNTEAEAIVAWNTRAERTCKVVACYSPSDLNDEVEWYFAFSCGCELYWDEAIPPNFCPNCGARVVVVE